MVRTCTIILPSSGQITLWKLISFPPSRNRQFDWKSLCLHLDLLGFTSNLATCLSVTKQTLIIKDWTHICPFCIAAHLAHRLTELLDFVPAISEQRRGKLELVPNKFFLSISWTVTETIYFLNGYHKRDYKESVRYHTPLYPDLSLLLLLPSLMLHLWHQ